jgi:hypothetical protein
MNKKEKQYSKELYPPSVLKQATRAYADIATIKVKNFGKATKCIFIEKDAPIQLVVNEFDNFLIEVLNERHDCM